VTRLPLDVHLMIETPERAIPLFMEAKADRITVHAEACTDLAQVVRLIRRLGAKVGVAIRPQTEIDLLRPCLDEIDLALLMTVNPGFGGQVDGGINHETARQTQSAGADVMVAGTYIFRASDTAQAIASLRGAAPPPKGSDPFWA
jgi:ribulose-phosphate 3-epimerase